MRSSATAQSGLRLLFATNHFITITSDRFLRAVPSFDKFDGWDELSELLEHWPPEGYDRHRHQHVETVRRRLRNRHWACQALA
eukprot:8542184-Pyramimonas_sp.AAC.1